MAEPISLAIKTWNSKFLSVDQMLDMAAKDYAAGELHGSSAFLMVLDRGEHGDAFSIGFRAANLKKSEIVALLTVEAAKLSMDLADG